MLNLRTATILAHPFELKSNLWALRKLTRQRTAEAYVRMLLRAYEFSSTLQGENIDAMEQQLIACDAFKEPKEGQLRILPRYGFTF